MVDVSDAGVERLHRQFGGGAEERLQLALSAGNFGVWDWDVATGAVSWSDEIYTFYGLQPGSLRPDLKAFVERVHPDDRADVQAAIQRALEDGEPYHVEFRSLRSDGRLIWLEAWGQTLRDDADEAVGMIGLVRDATARRTAEEERAQLLRKERDARAEAEAGRQRMAFLTQAFRVLGSSLDLDATVSRLLGLLVPHLGDWATLYLVRDGRVEALGGRHRDPDKQLLLDELIASVEVDFNTPGGVGDVLRTGASVLETAFSQEVLDEIELDADQRSKIDEIGIGSYMVVPLRAPDKLIGTLSIGGAVGARPYASDDLELAERIADRAGIAIQNAMQFTQRTKIAKVLQRSLLPAGLPSIPGCQLAGAYKSAGEGLDVGGDFYDVFQIDRDRFAVAIGDVSGKGHEAAAVTALTRHTLRATAVSTDDPRRVLAAANEVLLNQSSDSRFCTAAFGVGTVNDSGTVSIRLANAGHLPPLIVRRDGRIESVKSAGVLLGIYADAEFEAVTVELRPGDLLLLYTDGLTDVVVDGAVLGDEWLRSELVAVRDRPVSEIVRAIEERASQTGGVLVDDVAMLALRIVEPGEAT